MISLIEKFFAFFAKEFGLTNSASRTLNSISNYRNRAGAGRGRDIGHTVQSQALPENSFSAKKRRKVHKTWRGGVARDEASCGCRAGPVLVHQQQ